MKKINYLITALVLAMAVVGCGSSQPTQPALPHGKGPLNYDLVAAKVSTKTSQSVKNKALLAANGANNFESILGTALNMYSFMAPALIPVGNYNGIYSANSGYSYAQQYDGVVNVEFGNFNLVNIASQFINIYDPLSMTALSMWTPLFASNSDSYFKGNLLINAQFLQFIGQSDNQPSNDGLYFTYNPMAGISDATYQNQINLVAGVYNFAIVQGIDDLELMVKANVDTSSTLYNYAYNLYNDDGSISTAMLQGINDFYLSKFVATGNPHVFTSALQGIYNPENLMESLNNNLNTQIALSINEGVNLGSSLEEYNDELATIYQISLATLQTAYGIDANNNTLNYNAITSGESVQIAYSFTGVKGALFNANNVNTSGMTESQAVLAYQQAYESAGIVLAQTYAGMMNELLNNVSKYIVSNQPLTGQAGVAPAYQNGATYTYNNTIYSLESYAAYLTNAQNPFTLVDWDYIGNGVSTQNRNFYLFDGSYDVYACSESATASNCASLFPNQNNPQPTSAANPYNTLFSYQLYVLNSSFLPELTNVDLYSSSPAICAANNSNLVFSGNLIECSNYEVVTAPSVYNNGFNAGNTQGNPIHGSGDTMYIHFPSGMVNNINVWTMIGNWQYGQAEWQSNNNQIVFPRSCNDNACTNSFASFTISLHDSISGYDFYLPIAINANFVEPSPGAFDGYWNSLNLIGGWGTSCYPSDSNGIIYSGSNPPIGTMVCSMNNNSTFVVSLTSIGANNMNFSATQIY